MSVLDTEYVPVPLGYCPCEGTPHEDGDVVYLYPDLPAMAGVKARAWFVASATQGLDPATLEAQIAELWLTVGVVRWTFLLDDGSPVPLTPENIIRALPYGKGGRLVADKANDLYVDSVVAPLVREWEERSKPGSTRSSRPATSASTTSRRKRPSPSSTATTAKVPPPA